MLWVSKPLIVGALLLFMISKLKEQPSLRPIIVALFFSWLGDIALMYEFSWSFLAGMGAFALAQAAYIIWYLGNWRGLHLGSLVLSLALSAGALFALLTRVELPSELEFPVYAYFAIISGHLLLSAQSWAKAGVNLFPLIGTLLFVFSDWWIAWAKFGGGLKLDWHNGFVIMLTYSLAQAFIGLGIYHRLYTGSTS